MTSNKRFLIPYFFKIWWLHMMYHISQSTQPNRSIVRIKIEQGTTFRLMYVSFRPVSCLNSSKPKNKKETVEILFSISLHQ